MRGDATFCHEVDFGLQSVWGVQRYFEEQLDFFDRWLPDDADRRSRGGAAGADLRDGRRHRPARRRAASSTTAAAGGRARVAARAGRDHAFYLHGDGASRHEPAAGAAPRTFTFDPAHPVPTLGGLYCSIGELPAEAAGMEPAWARLLNPVLRLRDMLTPGPVDQKESPRSSAPRRPTRGCRSGRRARLPDRAAHRAGRGDRADDGDLWISSSAIDTDFTAKVVDVHPANEDYPEGFDMLLNDSIIRCRYREGFDREVFLEPGVPVPVTITLPPTSNLFDVGHRIRVDISSSNWPRLDVNPNTGEPMGRHTHQVVAEQTVYADAERPSHILLPVIPG